MTQGDPPLASDDSPKTAAGDARRLARGFSAQAATLDVAAEQPGAPNPATIIGGASVNMGLLTEQRIAEPAAGGRDAGTAEARAGGAGASDCHAASGSNKAPPSAAGEQHATRVPLHRAPSRGFQGPASALDFDPSVYLERREHSSSASSSFSPLWCAQSRAICLCPPNYYTRLSRGKVSLSIRALCSQARSADAWGSRRCALERRRCCRNYGSSAALMVRAAP